MNLPLLAVAIMVVGGAVVAVAERDGRVVLGGLAVAMGLAGFLADPLPGPLVLLTRLVGAGLAAYLLWIAGRGATANGGTVLGRWVEGLAAATAFVIGLGMAGPAIVGAAAGTAAGGNGAGAAGGAGIVGPIEAQAAGLALVVLGILPLVMDRDPLRLGIGLIVIIEGAVLLQVAWAGTPAPLGQLVITGLVVGLGAAVAAVQLAADHAAGRIAAAHERAGRS